MVKIPELPAHERPLEERHAIAGREWTEAAAEARRYRENKSMMRERMIAEVLKERGDMPHNKARHLVEASDGWSDFMGKLIEAANRAGELKEVYENLKLEIEMDRRRDIQASLERKYG